MPAPLLTPGQYDAIAIAIEAGEPKSYIAARFGISIATVHWTGLRLGADVPKHRRGKSNASPLNYVRNGHEVRQFTPEEDDNLLQMERTGMRIADIARAMRRAPNSIRGRLMTLARQESRREEKQ